MAMKKTGCTAGFCAYLWRFYFLLSGESVLGDFSSRYVVYSCLGGRMDIPSNSQSLKLQLINSVHLFWFSGFVWLTPWVPFNGFTDFILPLTGDVYLSSPCFHGAGWCFSAHGVTPVNFLHGKRVCGYLQDSLLLCWGLSLHAHSWQHLWECNGCLWTSSFWVTFKTLIFCIRKEGGDLERWHVSESLTFVGEEYWLGSWLHRVLTV